MRNKLNWWLEAGLLVFGISLVMTMNSALVAYLYDKELKAASKASAIGSVILSALFSLMATPTGDSPKDVAQEIIFFSINPPVSALFIGMMGNAIQQITGDPFLLMEDQTAICFFSSILAWFSAGMVNVISQKIHPQPDVSTSSLLTLHG